MPAILSTLKLKQSRLELFADRVEVFDVKASGTCAVPVCYDSLFKLDRYKDSILEQLRDNRDRIERRLTKLNQRKNVSTRSVEYEKSQLKERFNKFPNRVEIRLTRDLALFIFVDFHVRQDLELRSSFVPKIMSYSRSLTPGFSRGSGIFPVGVNKGGIEGRVVRIDVLKELFTRLEDVKRTLLDFAVAHGHGSACAMCHFVLGNSTTVRTLSLPPSLKTSDVARTKKEMEEALCQYLARRNPESLSIAGSLIIIMRPSVVTTGATTSTTSPGLENIESSEDDMDFQEVFLDAIR